MTTYRRLSVVLIPNPGSPLVTVVCPQVPGAVSQGVGEVEALANAREAIEAVAEARREQGLPPVEEDESLIEKEREWGYEIIREEIADTLAQLLRLDEETAKLVYPSLLEFAKEQKNLLLTDALQVTVRNVEVTV